MFSCWLFLLAKVQAEVPRFQLRAGVEQRIQEAQAVTPSLMQLCGEVRLAGPLAFTACGNGSGILHQRDTIDMAHFRMSLQSTEIERSGWAGHLSIGAGISEVQRGQDAAGFRFGDGEDGQVEAAGPELAGGVQIRRSTGAPILVDLTAGFAHIPAAPIVLNSGGTVLPFVGFSVGFFR